MRALDRLTRLLALGAVVASAFLPACGTVPETGRRQFVLLSAETERTLGAEAYAEQLKDAPIVTTGPDAERVARVGERIAEASRRRYPDAVRDFAWEFTLVDSAEVNAWMLPGGKSAVYTGILRIAETDDELAVVMGHEAAHAIARHGAERISRGMTAAVILGVASASGEVDPEIVAATALAYGALGETAFSRSEESEADEIGLIIAADAGYDPRSAVGFWKKMAALGNGGVPEFLSTHPSGETRAARLAQLMPRAMQVYEQSRSRTP